MAPEFTIVSAIEDGADFGLIFPCDGDENFTSVMSGAWGHPLMALLRLKES